MLHKKVMNGIKIDELHELISHYHETEFEYNGTTYVLQPEVNDNKNYLVIWDCTLDAEKCIAKHEIESEEDDVAFGPENLGVPTAEIRERVDAALDVVRMREFATRPPHLLSGGQKQRIAIAGVLAMKPDCIVFDEPTAMLDPRGRREIMSVIRELNKEGITIVLITHFMEEAAEADRIVILHDGEIAMDGMPEEIFENEDRLQTLNLEVPFAISMSKKLRSVGVDIPKDVRDMEGLVNAICQ